LSDDLLTDQDPRLLDEAYAIAKTVEKPSRLVQPSPVRAVSSGIGSGIGQGVTRTTGIGAGTKAVLKQPASATDKQKNQSIQQVTKNASLAIEKVLQNSQLASRSGSTPTGQETSSKK
jgi:hypothetical protein